MIPSYLPVLANHLWQSTLFAAAAWVLTIMLRENRARVRHAVWLAASIKFLVPMALLIGLGSQIQWRAGGTVAPLPIATAMGQASEPFSIAASVPSRWAAQRGWNRAAQIAGTIWLAGILGIGWAWWVRFGRVRSALRSGTSLKLDIPIRAVLSPAKLEPGVVGILRPVLLLPEGIFERLTPPQMATVVAHELCHVRNHDNLAAALQMLVETIFWFHPLVWWIGKRMVEERERACDEEVLDSRASDPRVYADAILGVCRMYVESPLHCVAGVAGADLRKRIEAIMENRQRQNMNHAKKALLCAAATASVLVPLAIGVANAPAVRAQAPSSESARNRTIPVSQTQQADIGTFVGGRYHHTLTGTEFSIPSGWTISYQSNSSGSGQQVGFTYPGDAPSPKIEGFV